MDTVYTVGCWNVHKIIINIIIINEVIMYYFQQNCKTIVILFFVLANSVMVYSRIIGTLLLSQKLYVAHPAACFCMLLGVVEQSLNLVIAMCKQMFDRLP